MTCSGTRMGLAGWRSFAAVAIVAMACFAGTAEAANGEKVSLNFVNADIESTVRAISLISGRNFLLDPRVKGTINVISSNPIAPELAYPILVSALRLQGFAVVEANGVTKVLPEAEAKTHALPTTSRGGTDARLVTRVFQIRNESASQLLPILRPLVTPNNAISVYPANNTLVITDYADNIRRLEKLIESIEQNASENPAVFRLKHVAAPDMAALLNRLFVEGAAAAAEAAQRPSIIADSRSNSLIVRSENPVVFGRIRALLADLDQAPANGGNIHVIALKNAEATKLAQTLRAILSGEASSPLAPAGGTAASATAAALPAAGAAAAGSSGSASTGLATGSSIQADAATNSLIIVAPEPVFRNLRAVIDVLDRRRAQVFIEALIVEITADRASELGFQWQSYAELGNSNARLIGGTSFGGSGTGRNIIEIARSPGAAGGGMTVGVVKGTITVPGLGTINNLAALARFLESDSDANILSTPNLITLDNEEGKIVIGQNLPFVTGQYAQTGASFSPTPFQTIERKDVGLSLKVKPQISEGGTVRVQIAQEASSVASGAASALGPVTNKRSIDSTVLVDDGGIIALGGLMEDSFGAGEDKVPVLGDIPVIGGLFRYGTRKRTKTNLMVFLRPQVVRDEAGHERIAAEHYRRLQGEQARTAAGDRLMPGEDAPPQLPALRLAPELKAAPLQPGK